MKFGVGHVELEMPTTHPNEDIKQEVRHRTPAFREEVRAGIKNVGVSGDGVPTLEKIIQRGNVQCWAFQELDKKDGEGLTRDMRKHEGYSRAEEVFQEGSCY